MVSAPFLKKLETFDAARRAKIILGMDRLRRKYQEASGSVDHVFHDIAEYLRDKETIVAYLALVKALGDPELMRAAYADTERARARIGASDQSKTTSRMPPMVSNSPFPTHLRPSPEKNRLERIAISGKTTPVATKQTDAPLRKTSSAPL